MKKRDEDTKKGVSEALHKAFPVDHAEHERLRALIEIMKGITGGHHGGNETR